ncbi:MAG TPA: hypothetical protein VFS40_09200 [Gemmatimonadales bacterium]|nr:hypothetical protein [Gemmatimonadales bacterium]
MSRHTVQQRRLVHRGREFHFVAYEAQVANAHRGLTAVPPSWFFMNEGKRHLVMPEVPGQAPEETERRLIAWLDANVFPPGLPPVLTRPVGGLPTRPLPRRAAPRA